jgi:hypothetical protein
MHVLERADENSVVRAGPACRGALGKGLGDVAVVTGQRGSADHVDDSVTVWVGAPPVLLLYELERRLVALAIRDVSVRLLVARLLGAVGDRRVVRLELRGLGMEGERARRFAGGMAFASMPTGESSPRVRMYATRGISTRTARATMSRTTCQPFSLPRRMLLTIARNPP